MLNTYMEDSVFLPNEVVEAAAEKAKGIEKVVSRVASIRRDIPWSEIENINRCHESQLVKECHSMSRQVTNLPFSNDFLCVIFTMGKVNGKQKPKARPIFFCKRIQADLSVSL